MWIVDSVYVLYFVSLLANLSAYICFESVVCVRLFHCVCVCMHIFAQMWTSHGQKCCMMGKCWQTLDQYGKRLCRTCTHTITQESLLIFIKVFFFILFYFLFNFTIIIAHASVCYCQICIYLVDCWKRFIQMQID